jgi:hypothetical protein
MNSATKEFLTKLSELFEEYRASLEIEGDSYGGPQTITLEVLNPKTWDVHYEEWLAEHPGQEYPLCETADSRYSFADYVDLGFHVDAEKIRSRLK